MKRLTLKPLRGVKRLLFLGDSITYSGGYIEEITAFVRLYGAEQPAQILNLGLPSETVSGLTEPGHAGGAFPRPDLHERLERVLARVKPDLVVACYGMNDGIYSPLDSERFAAYQAGVRRLAERVQRSGSRLCLLTPPPFDPQPIRATTLPAGRPSYPSGQPFVGYDEVLTRYSAWLLAQQKESGWQVIDIHTPLSLYLTERRRTEPDFAFAGDGVHLDGRGHRLIARAILQQWGVPTELLPPAEPSFAAPEDVSVRVRQRVGQTQRLLTDTWLTEIGHKRPGMAVGLPLKEAEARVSVLKGEIQALTKDAPPLFPGPTSDYHGFTRHALLVDGRAASVVAPHRAAPGNPWIWRAEFFDHRPELDLALLAKGFHLVYIDVGNTFGAPAALRHWDVFYKELTEQYGLSRKPTLEGLSRGGLYVYRWASANPTKVSVIYGDNPVCDFKSWPGGKGKGPGSPADWSKLQQDYGFHSEAEALAYKKNPIDTLEPLARARVPLLHLCGDADEVVPFPENTVVLKERYEALGGKITVIVKPGFKHHPHGLDDPTPIVQFILEHTKER